LKGDLWLSWFSWVLLSQRLPVMLHPVKTVLDTTLQVRRKPISNSQLLWLRHPRLRLKTATTQVQKTEMEISCVDILMLNYRFHAQEKSDTCPWKK
jgi:hypothetical protein